MPPTKFYLPYGTLSELYLHPVVTFHWFRVGREEPIASYERVILGYKSLTEEARARVEATVDEFFTEEEFHLLRDYLRQRNGTDLRTTVLTAPVSAVRPDGGSKAGALRPFALCPENPAEGSGWYRLADEEGYSLPFTVWGYYAGLSPNAVVQPSPIAGETAATQDAATAPVAAVAPAASGEK